MFATVGKKDNKINVFADEYDLCFFCRNLDVCPLLAALEKEAVILRFENIEVEKCGLFRKG
jgi:hypothetical protein